MVSVAIVIVVLVALIVAVDTSEQEKIMNSIKLWYFKNQEKISWFVTGWLTLSFFTSLSRGDYINAVIVGALIALNVALSPR